MSVQDQLNQAYERGYEDGVIEGVRRNSESRVSKFMEQRSSVVWQPIEPVANPPEME